MSWLDAIILGIVQGLTEFLPVSSSAHLRVVGEFLASGEPGARFTAVTQIGTEVAVLLYFGRDIVRIVGRWFGSLTGRVPRSDPDARMGWLVIIATVPIVIVGVLFQDAIEGTLRSLWVVAVVLIVFGVLLGAADALGRRVGTVESITWRDGILIGLAQVLALIPGVSRSGATITMGRALGYERPAAARFAFLLAVPAVLGSGLYELSKTVGCDPVVDPACGIGVYGLGETALATVVAFLVGLAVIAWLLRYLERGSFLPFVIYRILLGAVIIALLLTGVLEPLAGASA